MSWAALCACLVLLSEAHGDEVATKGRQVVEKWQNSVVTVRLVVKMTFAMGGSETHEEEQKSDVNGTAVDPSGLTVMSLFEADPSEMYKRMMAGQGGEEPQMNVESRVTGVKLRFADGTEVPAKIVLRDKDLDLAFVRPAEKLAQPVAAADLTQSVAPQLLDEVITLVRLGDSGNWAIAPRVDRIQAMLAKPRTVYVPQDSDRSGAPVFSLEGKIVGVTVVRVPSGPAATQGMEDMGGLAVILPAADILEVASQALAAQ
jgi:hypothetical protein